MKQIQLDQLDFDGIKQNLKVFLQGQNQFDSYNFEGSAMSTLLDILALNTHYNLLYTNMAINESFLDSASKRSSVISHAKALGYIAKSKRSARAHISVTVSGPTDNFLTMPKGTIFSAVVGNLQYMFSTLTDYTVPISNGTYTFDNVEVVQGSPVKHTIPYINKNTNFVIPNKDVDTTTLSIIVQNSASSSTSTKFTYSEDYTNIRSTETVYFIKQRDDLYTEVYFGDGAIGKALVPGNIVYMSYMVSDGSAANGANRFSYSSGWNSDYTYTVDTTAAGTGGAEEEDIESIRYNASRMWIAQNRAVTATDYDILLRSKYSSIESLHVWGGQDNVPKVYGKVFVCAKPFGRDAFTDSEKNDMKNSLILKKGVITTIPEFVDPKILKLQLTCNVYYSSPALKISIGELETKVRNVISAYGSTLNKFESVFRYSKLSGQIDQSDEAIGSNVITLMVRYQEQEYINVKHSYTSLIENPIAVVSGGGGFWSTRFYVSGITDRCYFKDDGNGLIWLYSETEAGTPTKLYSVGTINYPAGSWDIPDFTISGLHDSILEMVFVPASNDVASARNMIVSIEDSLVSVNMISDTVSSGSSTGSTDYTFTSVR